MLSERFFEKESFCWGFVCLFVLSSQTLIWQHWVGPTEQQVHSSGPLFPKFKCPANLLGKFLNNSVNSALLHWILVVEFILLSWNLLITLFELKVHHLVNTLSIILLSLLSLTFSSRCVCLFYCLVSCVLCLLEGLESVDSIKKCFIRNKWQHRYHKSTQANSKNDY